MAFGGRIRRALSGLVPEPLGRMPYEAALAAAGRALRSGSAAGAVEVWARNSFRLGQLVPLVSDLDLTAWFPAGAAAQDLVRGARRLALLKRGFPWLGEANFYIATDIPLVAKLMNPLELARDPGLAERVPAGSPAASPPDSARKAAFLLRMLESDLEQVTQTPRSRERKWAAHLEVVGERRDPSRPLLDDILTHAAALALPRAESPRRAELAASIQRYLEARLAGRVLGRLEPEHDWRAAFPHRLCYEPEPRPLIPSSDEAALAAAQAEWEVPGLLSQLPATALRAGGLDELMGHLSNLERFASRALETGTAAKLAEGIASLRARAEATRL